MLNSELGTRVMIGVAALALVLAALPALNPALGAVSVAISGPHCSGPWGPVSGIRADGVAYGADDLTADPAGGQGCALSARLLPFAAAQAEPYARDIEPQYLRLPPIGQEHTLLVGPYRWRSAPPDSLNSPLALNVLRTVLPAAVFALLLGAVCRAIPV